MTIDLNHKQTAAHSLSGAINALIDAGLTAEAGEVRKYLGASSLGHSCERAIQLDYIRANGLPGAPQPCEGFSGRTLRIFATGHALEPLAVSWLRAAGLDMRYPGPGFSVAEGRFQGHADGVVLEGASFAVPALWEHKTMNSKNWQEVVKKGVAAAKPVYAAQIALYQAYLDLQNPALFQATNKDTSEVYFELVTFDGALAQAVSDKAVRILQTTDAGELLPKAFSSAENFECKICRWREFCWA